MAWMAWAGVDYDAICAVHLWSHMTPAALGWVVAAFGSQGKCEGKRGEGSADGRKEGKKPQKTEAKDDPYPATSPPPSLALSMGVAAILFLGLPSCLVLCRLLSSPSFLSSVVRVVPRPTKDAVGYMFPVEELAAAYDIVRSFSSDEELLRDMLCHLLFVTFHVQVGLGYLGIGFLTSEQRRKNMLIRMDVDNPPPPGDGEVGGSNGAEDGKDANAGTDAGKQRQTKQDEEEKKFDPSRTFRRSAPSFILCVVLPYMFQIIAFGNLNNFAFLNVRDRIHRSVRVDELFDHDAHLTAMAGDGSKAGGSAAGPDVYASAMDTVVTTAYEVFNRKLFSLPKLALLPGVISRQPLLLAKIFPFIFLTDVAKGRIVASVTNRVEEFQREAREADAVRRKVEQFDLKNAELVGRRRHEIHPAAVGRADVGVPGEDGGGGPPAPHPGFLLVVSPDRWRRGSHRCLALQLDRAFVGISRGNRLQRNYVFVVLIECALAKFLAEGSIVLAEIFVFKRAIEDVVDLLLIRSRSESELATLMTQVDKLKDLDGIWRKGKEARLLPCRIASSTGRDGLGRSGGIVLNNLQYSRGTAVVSVEHLVVEPGIYAVTGANGSGKSTLFRLLMACESNERPIDLHDSIALATPLHQWHLPDSLPPESCKVPDEGCEVIEMETTKEEKDDSEIASDVSGDGGTAQEVPVTSITLPSSDVVEISQSFYWPLYSKPIDWIYQTHITSDLNETERQDCIRRVVDELQSLAFAQVVEGASSVDRTETNVDDRDGSVVDSGKKLMAELQEEKEDWFSELSGGQKSKVELVRKVFLREKCPSVLLVDETMAPLDPASKSRVMSKLKAFCQESVVLVIYHTDVGRGPSSDGAPDNECVPSNSFFDHNLHVEKKHLTTRPVC
ncbi:hypothetical protein ACHAWF_009681 [Thalassiosira exigua]